MRPRHQSGYAKLTSILGAAALSASLLVTQGLADEVPPSPLQENIDDSRIDEIIVKGKKTGTQIRREIRATEYQIYTLFNDLNTDDDYDIICRKITPVGSQIPRTNCKAQIYWDALSELAEDDEFLPLTPRPLANPAKHAAVLRQKLLDLAKSDPTLLQAMVKRKQLQKEEALLGAAD